MPRRRERVRRRRGREATVRIGLIVEGACEREAFRRLPGRLSNRPILDLASATRSDLGGLGDSMSPQAIARKVAPRALVLAPDNDRIVVCLDREGRAESARSMEESIRRALETEFAARGEAPGIPIEVVVADRAFEAWLLADINGLRAAKRRRALRNRCYEGWSERGDYGARVLRKALERYDKMDDGPRYFEIIDLARARLDCAAGRGWGSASLDRFLQSLGA